MPLGKKVIFLYCNVPLDVKMNNAKLPLLFSNNLESILLCVANFSISIYESKLEVHASSDTYTPTEYLCINT